MWENGRGGRNELEKDPPLTFIVILLNNNIAILSLSIITHPHSYTHLTNCAIAKGCGGGAGS